MEGDPLAGHRVVVDTVALAGLLLARHLADVGAEVAVLERPEAASLPERAALLRNTFSASADDAEARAALHAGADIVVVDENAEPPAHSTRAVVVAVPGGLDEGADLPWLVAAAAMGATAAAIFRRRHTGTGARIELRPDAIVRLLDVGAGDQAVGGEAPPADPRASDHLRARRFFEPIEGGDIAAAPWIISGVPTHARTRAPSPGEHTDELRRRFAEPWGGAR